MRAHVRLDGLVSLGGKQREAAQAYEAPVVHVAVR
jgi:hypothetical protein